MKINFAILLLSTSTLIISSETKLQKRCYTPTEMREIGKKVSPIVFVTRNLWDLVEYISHSAPVSARRIPKVECPRPASAPNSSRRMNKIKPPKYKPDSLNITKAKFAEWCKKRQEAFKKHKI